MSLPVILELWLLIPCFRLKDLVKMTASECVLLSVFHFDCVLFLWEFFPAIRKNLAS